MAGEWIETTIGEQATLQRGIDITKADQRAGTVPVISSSGVSSYHDTAAASGPGVVLGRKGVVGSVYYIPPDYWPHDTTLWVKDFHGNDRRFVYYFFRWLAPRIATMDVGSANPTLNRNHVHPIEMHWPVHVDEQRAIAHILGALDDKIELNRRMNETLEAIARELFKSWFVDFDPVRAKAESPDPRLPKEVADLFPARFVDSELGEIPEGWSAVALYDLATYVNGAAYAAFDPNDERRGLPIVKIAELKAGVTPQTKFSDAQMPEKYRITRGDILFSWSGNPDTSIDTFVWPHDLAWLNQHIFRVVPHRACERAFVLTLLRKLRPVLAEIARNKQTTGLGHVTATDMKRLLVVRPADRVMCAWNAIAAPMLERAFLNEVEIHSVTALRDALLPKLISGEIRVAA
jgi:type I restriction enzyme, S subunit